MNIAVVGQSGSGKSSYINTIRGIHDHKHPGNAKTDIVECTTEPARYDFPGNIMVTMWDLPGAGTANFRASEYATKMDFPSMMPLSSSRVTPLVRLIRRSPTKQRNLESPFSLQEQRWTML